MKKSNGNEPGKRKKAELEAIQKILHHPAFIDLDQNWNERLPIERARLMNEVLLTVRGPWQRLLARMLRRHIRTEGAVRKCLLKLPLSERLQSNSPAPIPAPPLREAPNGSKNAVQSLPPADHARNPIPSRERPPSFVISGRFSSKAGSIASRGKSLNTTGASVASRVPSNRGAAPGGTVRVGPLLSSNPAPTAPAPLPSPLEVRNVGDELLDWMKGHSGCSGFALECLKEVGKELRWISAKSHEDRPQNEKENGRIEHELAVWLLERCGSLENALQAARQAAKFFADHPFWPPPRPIEEKLREVDKQVHEDMLERRRIQSEGVRGLMDPNDPRRRKV